MWVLAAIVDIHVLEQLCAQFVLGKHTFDHMEEQWVLTWHDTFAQRLLLKDLRSCLTLAAWVACVGQIDAVSSFLSSESHLVGIDNNHVVTTVNVGGKAGFVLAAQDFSNLGAQATQHLIGSVYHDPFFLNVFSPD